MLEEICLDVVSVINADPAEGGECEDVDIFKGIGVEGVPAAVDGLMEGRVI